MALVVIYHSPDVLLASPSWTTYAPQAKLAGKKAIVVDTGFDLKWKLTVAALEKAIEGATPEKARILVLNNPGNPCEIRENSYRRDQI